LVYVMSLTRTNYKAAFKSTAMYTLNFFFSVSSEFLIAVAVVDVQRGGYCYGLW